MNFCKTTKALEKLSGRSFSKLNLTIPSSAIYEGMLKPINRSAQSVASEAPRDLLSVNALSLVEARFP
jgi:hypothetical protein